MGKKCNSCGKAKVVPVSTGAPSSPSVSKTAYVDEKPIVSSGQDCNIYASSSDKPKTYSDMEVAPSQAFDVTHIRSPEFKTQLVPVADATVVKNLCGSEEKQQHSTECQSCGDNHPEGNCLNTKALGGTDPEGYDLGLCWVDAIKVECITLLGRVGKKLAALKGEGALWLKPDGTVCAMDTLPLKVSYLWHKWFKPTPSSSPVIGQPMPFPYQVVADLDGNAHVIQGLAEEDSITVWDFEDQLFYQKPVTDFPVCVRERLEYSPRLELVGFEPLGVGDDPDMLRCLKRIEGEGILVFKQVETSPTPVCDCDECGSMGQVKTTTTVAEFLPNPEPCDVDCPQILAYVNGEPQWIDAAGIDCLKGDKGDDGVDGQDGNDGQDGQDGENCVEG